MRKVRLKPASKELKVRFEDPRKGHIPVEGAEVRRSAYYLRRIAEGGLVEVKAGKKQRP